MHILQHSNEMKMTFKTRLMYIPVINRFRLDNISRWCVRHKNDHIIVPLIESDLAC